MIIKDPHKVFWYMVLSRSFSLVKIGVSFGSGKEGSWPGQVQRHLEGAGHGRIVSRTEPRVSQSETAEGGESIDQI